MLRPNFSTAAWRAVRSHPFVKTTPPKSQKSAVTSATQRLFHMGEALGDIAAQLHAHDAAFTLFKRRVIALRLRLDQFTKSVVRLRNGHIFRRRIENLQKQPGVRPALMQLPGGM